MNRLFSLFNFFFQLLETYESILLVNAIALGFKIYLATSLIKQALGSERIQRSWILLLVVLICAIVSDSAWILVAVNDLYLPNIPYGLRAFWVRFTWSCNMIHYQALALFIESLLEKDFKLRIHNLVCLMMGIPFALFFLFFAFYHITSTSVLEKLPIEIVIQRLSIFAAFPVIAISIARALYTITRSSLPRITKQQLKVLLQFMIIPNAVSEMFQTISGDVAPNWVANSLASVSISTFIFTFALAYCTKKVVDFRFLNMHSHVKSSGWFSFFNNFKTMLDQLSQVTTMQELGHITQTFFKDAFGIPLTKSTLYLRQRTAQKASSTSSLTHESVEAVVDLYITNQLISTELEKYLRTHKILTYDEISFNNFHEENPTNSTLLKFLDQINADLFLPVYDQNNIVAYLIIERSARAKELYTDIERDEMLVFSNYLGTVMNLLQQRNMSTLMRNQHEMEHQLHIQQEQLAHYQETIQSFLRTAHDKEIGLIMYSNNHFTMGNKTARTLLPINLNTNDHNPLASTCRRLVKTILDYQAAHTLTAHDAKQEQLIFSGMPMPDNAGVMIAVHRPEVSDIINQHVALITNPAQWHYALHLATTRIGKHINQLFPGTTPSMLSFKIELIKNAQSNRATLITAATTHDIEDIVTLLHEASHHNLLHHIMLAQPSEPYEIAKKLFGISPVINQQTKHQALLKKLDGVGTLFLQDIHLLDKETQKALAEFIRYGYYRVFKTDHKVKSDVRIICSTHKSLAALVQEGAFCKELYEELTSNTLVVPSLITMQHQEFGALIHDYVQHIANQNGCDEQPIISSTVSYQLMHQRPTSLYELNKILTKAVADYAKKDSLIKENNSLNTNATTATQYAYRPATHDGYDPQLATVANMGKKALRDPEAMAILWKKFKNQNQIADFLNVNRSSVSRRCKEFNLG